MFSGSKFIALDIVRILLSRIDSPEVKRKFKKIILDILKVYKVTKILYPKKKQATLVNT